MTLEATESFESSLSAVGYDALSPDLQRSILRVAVEICKVYAAHTDEPEHGDVGWREQDAETHLDHMESHTQNAWWGLEGNSIESMIQWIDSSDGLMELSHALARGALALARLEIEAK